MAKINRNTLRVPITRPAGAVGGPEWNLWGQHLAGFCVQAHLDQGSRTRGAWAERVGRTASHLTAMSVAPNRAFLQAFDGVVNSADRVSRLRPDLTQLFDDLMPTLDSSASSLARYFDLGGRGRDGVVRELLEAEVVLARCRLPLANDNLDDHDKVGEAIDRLLVLASGPFGLSAIAGQRCAELGLLVPSTFLDRIDRFIRSSPVGFRAFRCLARFTYLWRAEAGGAAARADRPEIDLSLADLLKRLGAMPGLDPYPGEEWSIAAARERLHSIEGYNNPAAYTWLMSTSMDSSRSDRARLFALFSLRVEPLEGGSETKQRRIPRKAITPLRKAESDFTRRWADLLLRHGNASVEELEEAARESFSNERDAIGALSKRLVAEGRLRSELRRAFVEVVSSAVLTPDGQVRRHLVEALVAAGLVDQSIWTLLELDDGLDDPAVRETIVFLLGRLRQPDLRVVDRLLAACRGADPSAGQAAAWALGDIAHPSRISDQVSSTLLELATDPAGRKLVRVAAAHSLAVDAAVRQRAEGEQAGRAEAADSYLRRALKRSDDAEVGRLLEWGQRILPAVAEARKPAESPFDALW